MTGPGTSYRPDIDGLRAVAVLAVVVYHAGLALPGGYVGVDVFFVISGFLITGLIARDLDRGTFSMREFWKRRILRIWPAAFAMVFAVLIAALLLMMPRDLVETCRDAISQMLMTINITLWRTTDYFRPDSELRPLLHCWSLAVEEQFYLVLPPVLVLMWRFGRRVVWILLISGTILSFVLSIAMLGPKPPATFYLLPTRAWELAFGSILALLPRARLPRGGLGEGLAVAGLGLIVAPMFLYSSETPFPGLAALPVCLGAFILLGTPESGVNRLLSVGPMRAVGLASYSIYLWHWPIFAFLRYVEGRHLSPEVTIAALIATALAGALSWRFVEQPFRGKASSLGFGRTATVAGAVLACGIVVALVPMLAGGLPGRLDPSIRDYASPAPGERRWLGGGKPIALGGADDVDGPRLLLIGDSHGVAISGALHEAARARGIAGWAALRTGNCPIPDPSLGSDVDWLDRTIAWAGRNDVSDVLLCARWYGYLKSAIERRCGPEPEPSCEENLLDRVASHLAGLSQTAADHGIRLWFLTEVPDAPNPVRAAIRAHVLGDPLPTKGFDLDHHLQNQRRVSAVLSDSRVREVRIWDLAKPFFADGDGTARLRDARGVYYQDGNHINRLGASMLVAHLSGLVETIQNLETQQVDTPDVEGRQ